MSWDKIHELFNKYGNEEYMIGESITQINHALQAARIAEVAGAPNEIIIGLLLHDIGQLLGHNSSMEELHGSHDDIGYYWLKDNGFSDIICNIARYHTAAKVLLCRDDPDYIKQLSPASQESYLIQKEKYKDLILDHDLEEIVKACRLCDDMAKISDTILEQDLYYYQNLDPYSDISHEDSDWILMVNELYKANKEYPNTITFILK